MTIESKLLNQMILIPFFSEDNVLSDEILKNAIFFNIKVTKIEHSAFFWTPGIGCIFILNN